MRGALNSGGLGAVKTAMGVRSDWKENKLQFSTDISLYHPEMITSAHQ